MTPKVQAAVVAAVVGSVCASFGAGLVGRTVSPQSENGVAAPSPAGKPLPEVAKRTIVIDDDFEGARVGAFIFQGCLVDVVREVPLANGDTHWEIVLEPVRVRDRGDCGTLTQYIVEVTAEQAAHFAETEKKGGKFRLVLLPMAES
jgi:hypothetical protein